MFIIKIKGGLGNQLFQYALFTKMQKEGQRVFLDYSHIAAEMREINRSTIFDDFRLERRYHTHRMDGPMGYLYRRLFRRVFIRLAKYHSEQEESLYDPNLFRLKRGYLDGYWQSERYFEGCEKELRARLQFKKELSKENADMKKKICEADCAISIHVRLGDYEAADNAALFGNICTQAYYEKAVSYFKQKYENPTFFVFSNNPKMAVEILNMPGAVIVDINDEETAWADMYLMSQCHHNIIANSSFSWWGAWLNANTDKTVIAPKKWINGKETKDICPDSWLRM